MTDKTVEYTVLIYDDGIFLNKYTTVVKDRRYTIGQKNSMTKRGAKQAAKAIISSHNKWLNPEIYTIEVTIRS